MKRIAAVLLCLVLAPAAQARPVLLEMFTSLGCSSCPPADALLTKSAANANILALSYNITYWNNAAFTDPYALPAATTRQMWYASLGNSTDVYTPEAVVDGTASMVGSDAGKVGDALAGAAGNPAGDVAITIKPGPMVGITLAADTAVTSPAEITLIGYDASHKTQVGGGENAGAAITETNVVRSVQDLGPWSGQEMSLSTAHPAGAALAVILQTRTGAIVGLGVAPAR
jgi:hypothetical protein